MIDQNRKNAVNDAIVELTKVAAQHEIMWQAITLIGMLKSDLVSCESMIVEREKINSGLAREVTELRQLITDICKDVATALECEPPIQTSMYDEEGVEGWEWKHSNGDVWQETGAHDEPPPHHPLLVGIAARAQA